MTRPNIHLRRITRDFYVLVLSIVATAILFKTGALETVVAQSLNIGPAGAFITGIFFTSIFTIAPAGVVLALFALHQPALSVVFFGALGAVVGDLVIYLYIKDTLAPDIYYVVHKVKDKRIRHFFHLRMWRWLTPFVAALIIASPLPDEIGLAMMGLSRTSLFVMIPISFTFNFLSVLAIVLAVTHL